MMTTSHKTSPKLHNVFLLAGVEEYSIRRELDRLVAERLSEDARGFDYNEFRSAEVDAAVLWNALITLPLFADNRIVVLHLQGDPKEELVRTLNRYTVHPSPTTTLLIIQVFEDRGTPLRLEGEVQTITFPALNASKRAQWSQDYVRKFGKELSGDGAEYVVSTSKSRLADIAAKLDHAMLFSGDQREISARDLMQVSGVTSEFLPWDLEDAILERHAQKIFERARAMEAGGEELLRLLAYQRTFLMQLWMVGSVSRSGQRTKSDRFSQETAKGDISKVLGKKEWKSRQYMEAYLAIGESRLRRSLVDLLQLEVSIKTGRAGWPGYYEWLWKLAGPSGTEELQVNDKS